MQVVVCVVIILWLCILRDMLVKGCQKEIMLALKPGFLFAFIYTLFLYATEQVKWLDDSFIMLGNYLTKWKPSLSRQKCLKVK